MFTLDYGYLARIHNRVRNDQHEQGNSNKEKETEEENVKEK